MIMFIIMYNRQYKIYVYFILTLKQENKYARKLISFDIWLIYDELLWQKSPKLTDR